MDDIVKRALEILSGLPPAGPEPSEAHTVPGQVPTPSNGDLLPGALIEWRSPLFGLCQGRVALIEGDRVLIDQHPVTGEPVWICLDWVVSKDQKESI